MSVDGERVLVRVAHELVLAGGRADGSIRNTDGGLGARHEDGADLPEVLGRVRRARACGCLICWCSRKLDVGRRRGGFAVGRRFCVVERRRAIGTMNLRRLWAARGCLMATLSASPSSSMRAPSWAAAPPISARQASTRILRTRLLSSLVRMRSRASFLRDRFLCLARR